MTNLTRPDPTVLDVTDVVELEATLEPTAPTAPPPGPVPHTAGDRGLVAAFCGLLWSLLLVGAVGYLGAVAVNLLQQPGGDASVRR